MISSISAPSKQSLQRSSKTQTLDHNLAKAFELLDFKNFIEFHRQGGNLTQRDHLGRGFLERAVILGLIDFTEYLFHNIPNVNVNALLGKENLLHLALKEKHYLVSRFLIQHKANPCMTNKGGESPLYLALRFSHSLASDLINRGADVNTIDYLGNSPLHDQVLTASTENVAFLLSQKSIQVNIKDKLGRTPLFLAIMFSHYQTISLLLHNGANPNEPSNIGETPISIALRLGNTYIIKALLLHQKVFVSV